MPTLTSWLRRSPEAEVICILGMHRSGTSCLAGILQELGLELGKVKTSAPDNEKGNLEHRTVHDLNQDLLHFNNGAWDQVPDQLEWDEQLERRRTAFLRTITRRHRRWGVKDPRMLITMPFWSTVLPNPKLIGTFRHPLAVVRSLEAREEVPRSDALDLWCEYNSRLLALQRAEGFPLVSFDWSPSKYLSRVLAAAGRLGLNPDAGTRQVGFFDEHLRHQVADDERDVELPSAVADVYAELKNAAEAG